MTQSSTISFERLTPKIRKITFANPPVNLMLPETVARLRDLVVEMSEDPEVHVAIFTSSTPDYFFNHFDLAQAAGLPRTRPRTRYRPTSISSCGSRRHRSSASPPSAGGPGAAGTNWPWPATCATPAVSTRYSAIPRWPAASFPAVAAANASLG